MSQKWCVTNVQLPRSGKLHLYFVILTPEKWCGINAHWSKTLMYTLSLRCHKWDMKWMCDQSRCPSWFPLLIPCYHNVRKVMLNECLHSLKNRYPLNNIILTCIWGLFENTRIQNLNWIPLIRNCTSLRYQETDTTPTVILTMCKWLLRNVMSIDVY